MKFAYKGRTFKGKVVKGKVEAVSASEASEILKDRGVVVIEELIPVNDRFEIRIFKERLKDDDVLTFLSNLKSILSAGITIVEALELIQKETSSKRLKEILEDVKNKINEGEQLSTALSAYKDEFGDVILYTIKAGEESGRLIEALNRLSLYVEKKIALKNKLKSATFYPAFVVVTTIGLIALLLTFVVPKFKEMYADLGGNLPALTQLLLNASDWFKAHYVFLLVGLIAVVAVFKVLTKNEKVKYTWDRFALKLPLFGKLFLYANVSNFAFSLASMIDAGLDVVKAIETSMKTMKNSYLKKLIAESLTELKEGEYFSASLSRKKVFPALFISFYRIGEKTGRLSELLEKIAKHYEDVVNKIIDGLTKLVEPVLMLVIGGIVGFIIVALYLPIFKMGELLMK